MSPPPDKPSLADRIEALADGHPDMTTFHAKVRAIAAELREIAAMLREDGDPTCVYDAACRLAGKEGT